MQIVEVYFTVAILEEGAKFFAIHVREISWFLRKQWLKFDSINTGLWHKIWNTYSLDWDSKLMKLTSSPPVFMEQLLRYSWAWSLNLMEYRLIHSYIMTTSAVLMILQSQTDAESRVFLNLDILRISRKFVLCQSILGQYVQCLLLLPLPKNQWNKILCLSF